MDYRADIESVVQWLESVDEDEAHWEDQIDLTTDALSELRRMSAGTVRLDKTGSRSAERPTFTPESRKAAAAIPHVDAMVRAMFSRSRTVALESGKAALAVLS